MEKKLKKIFIYQMYAFILKSQIETFIPAKKKRNVNISYKKIK